jgi:hypothetical protein
MCTVFALYGVGQYTYFDQVIGEFGDDASETKTNIEVLNDKFYTWGGGIASSVIYEDIIVFDEEGLIIDEREYPSPDAFVYIGNTNSFQRIPGEGNFLFSHGLIDANGIHGFLMKVDDELDTLWTRLVDVFPGETYIFTHAWDSDGFILAAEHQVAGVGNGTFIAKVDVEGEYLWHTVLHEPEEGSYRNRYISVIPEGYIVSGSEGGGASTEGQIEFFDNLSQELHTFVNSESAISRGIMTHFVRENGEILVTQTVRLVDYPGALDPFYAYSNSNLFRLDIDNLELELLESYDGDGDWITPFIYKSIESSQDGLVQLGRTFLEVNGSLRQFSFVMKLTEEYQVDWYTELSYEVCSGCTNELYDIEQAPDGGYVMVGNFNSPEDPYDKTGLVKVDACGDLVWQGCDPVGIQEFQIQDSRLELYPNPVSGNDLNIRFPREVVVERVVITDALGRFEDLKFEIGSDGNLKSQIPNLKCPTGLYSLLITTRDGSVYSGKLVIE